MLIRACLKRPPLNAQLLSFEAKNSSQLAQNKLFYAARWGCERSHAGLIESEMGIGAL